MKYEKIILDSFERMGFTPRPGQVEAVNKIIVECIDNKKKNIVLCAPTGTGKSIIGAIAAESLSIAKGKQPNAVKSSISCTATNVLAKQYDNTFQNLAKDKKYIMIKGAANYPCTVLSTPEESVNAESCAFYTMLKNKGSFEQVIKSNCDKCEYMEIKKQKNTVRHLTTNYSYYFIDRMYSGGFEDRDLVVWDEAHLINDLFSEHNAIHFSQKRLQGYVEEVAEAIKMIDLTVAKNISLVVKHCGVPDKINESNYKTYLQTIMEFYAYAAGEIDTMAERAMRSNNLKQYSSLVKKSKKYEGLACKIDDFFKYTYEHVFEYKQDEKAISIKPIFVGKMFDNLWCAPHNLFMSATVSEDFMTTTLNLNKADTAFIQLEPTFPKENKEVVFFDPLTLNYTSLQNAEVVKNLRKNTLKIVKHHLADNERGIILSPSFKLQNEIIDELKPLIASKQLKLFEHRQGEKLEHVLNEFKNYKGHSAILISPAMFEGVDLPGDLSRFQILIKAPFPSLGDKRMKFILDKHPNIYQGITIMKMVQGAGRSVRSVDDFATTYCLDINGQRTFTSTANIWKNEFTLRFTKFL